MAVSRENKDQQLAFLKEKFAAASSVVLTDFTGLTVNDTVELRARFRNAGVVFKVVKNTLARRAVQGTAMEAVKGDFTGPIGVAFGVEDPAIPARVALDFCKTNDKLKIRCGCVEGNRLDEQGVETLSKLPSKSELRAMFLGVLNAPAQKLVGILAAPPRELAGVLKAYEDKRSEG